MPRYRSRLPQNQDNDSSTLLTLFKWLLQTVRSPGYALTLVLALQVSMIEPSRADERSEYDDDALDTVDNNLVSSLANDISTDHLDLTVEDWDLSQLSSYDSEPNLTGSVLDRQSDANSEAECPAKGPSPGSPLSYVRMQLLAYNNVQVKQVELDLWQNIWALARIDDNQNTLMMKWSKYGNLQWAKELVNFKQPSGKANPLSVTPKGTAWFAGSANDNANQNIGYGQMSSEGIIKLARKLTNFGPGYGQSITAPKPSTFDEHQSLWLAGYANTAKWGSGYFVASIDSKGNPEHLNTIKGKDVGYKTLPLFIRYNMNGPILAASGEYYDPDSVLSQPFYVAQFKPSGHLLAYKAFYNQQDNGPTKTSVRDFLIAKDGSIRILADLQWPDTRSNQACFAPMLIKMTPSYEISWAKTFEAKLSKNCPQNGGEAISIDQANTIWLGGNISLPGLNIDNHSFLSQISDDGSIIQAVNIKANFKGSFSSTLSYAPDNNLYMGGYYLINKNSRHITLSRAIPTANKTLEGNAFEPIDSYVSLDEKKLNTTNSTPPIQYVDQLKAQTFNLSAHNISFNQIEQKAHGQNQYSTITTQPGVLSQYPIYRLSFGGQHHTNDFRVRLANGSALPKWLTYHQQSGLLDSLYPVDEPRSYLTLKLISLVTSEQFPFELSSPQAGCLTAQAFVNGLGTFQNTHASEITDITSDDDHNMYLLGMLYQHQSNQQQRKLFIARQNNDSSFSWLKTLNVGQYNIYRAVQLSMNYNHTLTLTSQIASITPNTQASPADFFWSDVTTSGKLLKTQTITNVDPLNNLEAITFNKNGTMWGAGGNMLCKFEPQHRQCENIQTFLKKKFFHILWQSIIKDGDRLWLTGWSTIPPSSSHIQTTNKTQQQDAIANNLLTLAQANQEDLKVNWVKTLNTPYSTYGNAISRAKDGSIWVTGYLSDDLHYFVANFNEWGLINWHKVIAGRCTTNGNYLPTLKKCKALTQMQDGSIITATPWRPADGTYTCILLLHWKLDGEIKEAVTINNANKDMYVYELHNHDRSLKLGTDDGFFSLPYYNIKHPLSPDSWYIPNSEWSFHVVNPLTYSVNMPTKLFLHTEVAPFKPDITSVALQANDIPYLLRPFPQLAAPSLAQTVDYRHPFSINLLQKTPPHYGNIFLNKINLNNGFTWLTADFTNHRINGTPTGLVRGRYPVDFQLKYGIERPFKLSYQMVINVPNKPPYYAGPRKIRFFIDGLDVSSVIPKHFFDPENDTITSYNLETTSSSPLWLNLNTKTGVMSATMISGYQGNYTIDILATDQFGATGSQTIQLEVPNRSPNITLAPQTVYVNNIRTLAIPQQDQDGDRIEIQSIQFDEQSGLPSWITLSQESNTLVFTPKTDDQGPHHIKVNMRDCFQHTHSKHQHCGHSVSSLFNLTVPNRSPVLKQPFSDQTIKLLQQWHYSIADHFQDPDGDSLHYTFEHKPGWLHYDPKTKRLKAHLTSPFKLDNHEILVRALDGHGAQAQGYLKLKPTLSWDFLKFVPITIGTTLGLLGFLGLMGYRRTRLQSRQQHVHNLIAQLLFNNDSEPTSSPPETTQLIDQFDQVSSQINNLESAQPDFFAWAQLLNRYYMHVTKPKPITHFLITNKLIESLTERVCDDDCPQRLNGSSSKIAARLLNDSCFLLLAFHSAKQRELSSDYKTRVIDNMDSLLSKQKNCTGLAYQVDDNNLDEVITLHQLICARQSMLYTKDDETRLDAFLSAMRKIISPSDLFMGIYRIWHDIPEKWFMHLMDLWKWRTNIQLGYMKDSLVDIECIQEKAYEETNWTFRFALVDIYIDLIKRYSQDTHHYEALINQLVYGGNHQLGLKDLLTEPHISGSWYTSLSCRRHLPREYRWVKSYAWAQVDSLDEPEKSRIKQAVNEPTEDLYQIDQQLITSSAWSLPSDGLFAYSTQDNFAQIGNTLSDQASTPSIQHAMNIEADANLADSGSCCQRLGEQLSYCWRSRQRTQHERQEPDGIAAPLLGDGGSQPNRQNSA